jgi:hypothetical protein
MEDKMNFDPDMILKNLSTFTNAYGLKPSCKKLIEELYNSNGNVKDIGVLLRDPVTKKGFISCHLPVIGDFSERMLWVPIDERSLEAVPLLTRKVKEGSNLKRVGRKLKDKVSDDQYSIIEENAFKLIVPRSLCKRGVIEKYFSKENYGFIRRNRRGIYFKRQWCRFAPIDAGQEVLFVPIITRKGLQARAIKEVGA